MTAVGELPETDDHEHGGECEQYEERPPQQLRRPGDPREQEEEQRERDVEEADVLDRLDHAKVR